MLIFLDLETTGVGADDEICALSFICENQLHSSLLKPSKKLKPSAMAIHNITNEMLCDKAIFRKSEIYQKLSDLNVKTNTIVVHNAEFMMMMLDSSGLTWQGEVLDTKRVSMHLIEELDSYELQYLRYELKLYKEESQRAELFNIFLQAHHSDSDVIHIELLYHYLLDLSSIEELIKLSEKKVLYKKMPFGKYKDQYIDEILLMDANYLHWVLHNMEELNADLSSTLEYYLNESSY